MFTYFSPVLKGKYGINKITAFLIVLTLIMASIAGYSYYEMISLRSQINTVNNFTHETSLIDNKSVSVPPGVFNPYENITNPSSRLIQNYTCENAGYLIISVTVNNSYQLYAGVPIPEINANVQVDSNRISAQVSPSHFALYPNETVSYLVPILPGSVQISAYNWGNQTLFTTVSLFLYT